MSATVTRRLGIDSPATGGGSDRGSETHPGPPRHTGSRSSTSLMSTGLEVSTSTQISAPIGSRTSTASRILRSVASPGCGPPRRRRTYRSTATSAGTRQSTSPMVVLAAATACRRVRCPAAAQSRCPRPPEPVAALRWSASWLRERRSERRLSGAGHAGDHHQHQWLACHVPSSPTSHTTAATSGIAARRAPVR